MRLICVFMYCCDKFSRIACKKEKLKWYIIKHMHTTRRVLHEAESALLCLPEVIFSYLICTVYFIPGILKTDFWSRGKSVFPGRPMPKLMRI